MHALTQQWCRMWNDDANLAHKLVTSDFRIWFGSSANGDGLNGADGLARFVDGYQRSRGNRFTPRLIVADEQAQRFAFTWDVALPDGSVVGGSDLGVLRGGLIAELWSITGERAVAVPEEPVTAPEPAGNADRAELDALCQAWSALWNGDTALAADVVTDNFRIWFGSRRFSAEGDAVTGPAAFAAFIRRFREGREGLTFAKHHVPVIDAAGRSAAFTWSATAPLPDGGQRTLGGIDVFQIAGRRFSRCWSLTGTRAFTF